MAAYICSNVIFYTSSKRSFVKGQSFFWGGGGGIHPGLLCEAVFYVTQAFQKQRVECTIRSGFQLGDGLRLREGQMLSLIHIWWELSP